MSTYRKQYDVSTTAKQTPSQALLTKKRASAPKKRQDEFETKALKILEKPDSILTITEDKSFFDSILPIVENLDEDDKLQFRIEVLQLVQRFKRKQKCDAFNMTSIPIDRYLRLYLQQLSHTASSGHRHTIHCSVHRLQYHNQVRHLIQLHLAVTIILNIHNL
ncbi:unnamed protein product [Acanthoscelides obtectus]|uniref:BESS domain-containing protein n=1 Tax=Acanthoscelides obtectus TaxID=200917 RepID=A0A9P0JSU5_ACAOB|nr:unnamed protein product [Acanthoscelides obtectus]CAK1633892.1 hypothetical protein AOBTE_LOCUS8464 [Acanthoscelides obtectus]